MKIGTETKVAVIATIIACPISAIILYFIHPVIMGHEWTNQCLEISLIASAIIILIYFLIGLYRDNKKN